ncbi:MAG: hypothetical protein ACK6DY_01440, partial [Acidobacteriota bacterium]
TPDAPPDWAPLLADLQRFITAEQNARNHPDQPPQPAAHPNQPSSTSQPWPGPPSSMPAPHPEPFARPPQAANSLPPRNQPRRGPARHRAAPARQSPLPAHATL